MHSEASRRTLPPIAAAIPLTAVAAAGVAIYVLRPLELERDWLGGWNAISPAENTWRIGFIWLVFSILITVVCAVVASSFGGRTSAAVGWGALGFGMIALASVAPAFQMHNQLESIRPWFDRPDFAGGLLRALWVLGLVGVGGGIVLVTRNRLWGKNRHGR